MDGDSVMAEQLAGMAAMIAKLRYIKGEVPRKAAKAGINAGLTVLVKSIREYVDSSSASGPLKAAARGTIGKNLRMAGGGDYLGKAGFGVGRMGAVAKMAAHARSVDKAKQGVGISARNIHWPILGTKAHGKGGGNMPRSFVSVMGAAVVSAEPGIISAMAKQTERVIAREAKK
jgi:hypothetical protein